MALPPVFLLSACALFGADRPPAVAGPATSPADVALFKDAIKSAEQDTEHWAYTETTVSQYGKKLDKGETVVRFDPSKPYAEQFTPLLVDGKPPTAKQLKKYRQRGEKRGEQLAKGELPGDGDDRPDAGRKKRKELKLDLEHPQLVAIEGENCIFRVPLEDHGTGVPVDKVEVRVVIHQPTRQIRHASLRILDSFRVKVVAKVKAGEASLDFAVVAPNFGPVITSATGSFGGSLLFVPVNGVFRSTRTDWQRVKAYNERFGVKIGPLKALDMGR